MRVFPVLLWAATRDGTVDPVFPAGLVERGLLLLDDGARLDEDSGEEFTTVTAAQLAATTRRTRAPGGPARSPETREKLPISEGW